MNPDITVLNKRSKTQEIYTIWFHFYKIQKQAKFTTLSRNEFLGGKTKKKKKTRIFLDYHKGRKEGGLSGLKQMLAS